MSIRASINTALRGYLDLFQLRTGGQNPQVAADFVQPNIDLQRWYLESRATLHVSSPVVFNVTTNASGFFFPVFAPVLPIAGGTVTVPTNEIWVFMPGTRVSVSFSANAGQEAEIDLLASNAGGQADWFPLLPRSGFSTSLATPIRGHTRTLPEPYFVRPGAAIQGYQYGITCPAGSISIDAMLRLVRLRI